MRFRVEFIYRRWNRASANRNTSFSNNETWEGRLVVWTYSRLNTSRVEHVTGFVQLQSCYKADGRLLIHEREDSGSGLKAKFDMPVPSTRHIYVLERTKIGSKNIVTFIILVWILVFHCRNCFFFNQIYYLILIA